MRLNVNNRASFQTSKIISSSFHVSIAPHRSQNHKHDEVILLFLNSEGLGSIPEVSEDLYTIQDLILVIVLNSL